MIRLGIVDCGISNVASVHNAFSFLGVESRLIREPKGLRDCSHVVLPGDGAFPDGMRRLSRSGLDEAIIAGVHGGKPLLGICLGMQLMAEEGDEFQLTRGLGLTAGRVTQIEPNDQAIPIPQVGWNEVSFLRVSPLTKGFAGRASFYFMHSFAFCDVNASVVAAICDYGGPVVSIIEQGLVFGVQFHPEKSQRAGLRLLKNFSELEC